MVIHAVFLWGDQSAIRPRNSQVKFVCYAVSPDAKRQEKPLHPDQLLADFGRGVGGEEGGWKWELDVYKFPLFRVDYYSCIVLFRKISRKCVPSLSWHGDDQASTIVYDMPHVPMPLVFYVSPNCYELGTKRGITPRVRNKQAIPKIRLHAYPLQKHQHKTLQIQQWIILNFDFSTTDDFIPLVLMFVSSRFLQNEQSILNFHIQKLVRVTGKMRLKPNSDWLPVITNKSRDTHLQFWIFYDTISVIKKSTWQIVT